MDKLLPIFLDDTLQLVIVSLMQGIAIKISSNVRLLADMATVKLGFCCPQSGRESGVLANGRILDAFHLDNTDFRSINHVDIAIGGHYVCIPSGPSIFSIAFFAMTLDGQLIGGEGSLGNTETDDGDLGTKENKSMIYTPEQVSRTGAS